MLAGALLVSLVTTVTGVVVGVVRGDEQRRRARLHAHWRPYAAARGYTISGGRMHGMLDGVPLCFDTLDGLEEGEPCVLTRVSAPYQARLVKHLQVFPENPILRIVREHPDAVELDDAEFDRIFVVRAEPEAEGRALLDPLLRRALLRFARARQLQLAIDGKRASLRWMHALAPAEALDEAAKIVVAAARGPRAAYR